MIAAPSLPLRDRVVRAIESYEYVSTTEEILQECIFGAIRAAGIDCERERKSGRNRFDIFVANDDGNTGIVVEVKIKGSWADLARQINRYTLDPIASEIIVASTRRLHLIGMPEMLGGKHITPVYVGRPF